VDYYLIRHGHYDVRSFFTRRGIYGTYVGEQASSYVITLAVQVPFLKQTFYTGSLVNTVNGEMLVDSRSRLVVLRASPQAQRRGSHDEVQNARTEETHDPGDVRPVQGV